MRHKEEQDEDYTEILMECNSEVWKQKGAQAVFQSSVRQELDTIKSVLEANASTLLDLQTHLKTVQEQVGKIEATLAASNIAEPEPDT